MEKLPLCILGDGCLLRLTDQKHDENYKHTTSAMPRCLLPDCPLYHKAYNFIIGDQTYPTRDIKDAQRHSSLHYHPPIRSKGVFKSRPRAVSHIYPPKTQERPTLVPKLDLDILDEPPKVNDRHTQNLKKMEEKHKSPIRASSDPSRDLKPKSRIFISPKRSENKDYTDFKNVILKDVVVLKEEIYGMKSDMIIIKNLLLELLKSEE